MFRSVDTPHRARRAASVRLTPSRPISARRSLTAMAKPERSTSDSGLLRDARRLPAGVMAELSRLSATKSSTARRALEARRIAGITLPCYGRYYWLGDSIG